MDVDGIPLAFSLFPVNVNEQTSLKPLEKKNGHQGWGGCRYKAIPG